MQSEFVGSAGARALVGVCIRLNPVRIRARIFNKRPQTERATQG